MIPYMLALCIKSAERNSNVVLTAIAAIDHKRTLFATCKHGVQEGMVEIFLCDERVRELVSPMNAWAAPAPDLDLAFVAFDFALPLGRPVRINEARIGRETLISHARNVVARGAAEAFQVTTAMTRQSPYKAVREQNGSFSALDQPGDLEKARAFGFQTLYGVLEMQSWPGVSGSALWDRTGSIRGMVCGGSDDKHPAVDEVPRLIYLPIKKIMKEAQHVLQLLR